MITVNYAPNYPDSYAVPDGQVEEAYSSLLYYVKEAQDVEFYFSTSVIFTRIQLGLVRDELRPEDICIKYNGDQVYFNEYGACQAWPEGFCDLEGALTESVIKEAIGKKRRQRGQK